MDSLSYFSVEADCQSAAGFQPAPRLFGRRIGGASDFNERRQFVVGLALDLCGRAEEVGDRLAGTCGSDGNDPSAKRVICSILLADSVIDAVTFACLES